MRSQELQNWIDEQENPKKVAREFTKLPENLFFELLEEALEIPDIKAAYDSWPETLRDERAIKKYCQGMGIMGKLHLQLPGKNDGNTASPNFINTSSLFVASRWDITDDTRPNVYMKPVVSREGIDIRYSGELLTQYDWDVLQALTDLCDYRFNEIHNITAIRVLRYIGRDVSGGEYSRLERSLVRLSTASIYIKKTAVKDPDPSRRRPKIVGVIGLLNHMLWIRGEQDAQISYSIDRYFGYLSGYGYGLVDWQKRRLLQMNELAKKLQVVFMGHSDHVQFHSIQKLIELCGYTCTVTKFTEYLKSALARLLQSEIIYGYWISLPKRGESDKKVCCVWVKGAPDKNNPIPTRAGVFYGPGGTKKTSRTHTRRTK